MSTEPVILTIEGRVAMLTLNVPDKLNALSPAMRKSLGAHLETAFADPELTVILLRGEGRAFCAGVELNDIPQDPFAWRRRVRMAQRQHFGMVNSDKVVIAAVQGAAFGGGASLALAADIMIVADNARFGFPFVKLGVVPDGGGAFLLQSKVGPSVAADLLLSGGEFNAEEAKALGLTRRIVPAAELHMAAGKLAQEISILPAEALALTKSLVVHGWAHNAQSFLSHEGSAFGLATASDSHAKALSAARARLSAPKTAKGEQKTGLERK